MSRAALRWLGWDEPGMGLRLGGPMVGRLGDAGGD